MKKDKTPKWLKKLQQKEKDAVSSQKIRYYESKQQSHVTNR